MSPTEPASDASSAHTLSLPEIIFSCGVCQASVSEIYAAPESNKGFHSGSGDDDGVVTKLWIAECSHVTCGKHLAGGAAPFHPQGEPPKAACPQCAREGDDTPKSLYGIRGLDDGEHDQAIPSAWFRCPPITLDGTAPGMEAVRFQFMALARYSQKIHTRWKTAEEKRETAVQVLSRERKLKKQFQAQLSDAEDQARSQTEALKRSEGALKKWEERMPIINNLMAAVKPMADDLRQMRLQLLDLGFDVPTRSYGFGDANGSPAGEVGPTKPSSPRDTPVHENKPSSSSSRKRKRNDYGIEPSRGPHAQRTSSRDLMLPPPTQRLQRQGAQSHADLRALPASKASQYQSIYDHASDINKDHREPLHPQPQATQPLFTHEENPYDVATLSARYDHYAFDQPYEDYLPRSHYSLAEDQPKALVSVSQHRNTVQHSSRPIPYQSPNRQNLHSPYTSFQPGYYDQTNAASHSLREHQQWPARARQPLRPVPIDHNEPQTPLRATFLSPETKGVKNPLRPNQTTTGAISSPFSQRGGAASSSTVDRRPPTRGSNTSKTSRLYGQQLRNSRNPQSYGDNVSGGTQHHDTLQTRSGFRMQERAPTKTTLPYRGHLNQDRMNGDNAHFLQRPPQHPEFITSPHGLITLPPSSAGTKDTGLSSIRGVRGGFSQRNDNYSLQHQTGSSRSRPLFTAVSRRSVRR